MRVVALDINALRAALGDTFGEPAGPGELGNLVVPVLDLGRFLSPALVQSVQISGGVGVLSQDQSELWNRGNSRTSGAGVGQKSGVIELYQSELSNGTVQRLQIVSLRVVPSVAAILRLYYATTDVFTGAADLASLANNALLSSSAGEDWGAIEAVTQTATPDTTNIANHSAMQRGGIYFGLQANQPWDWPLERGPLHDRLVTNQNMAMGWGVWGVVDNTAITVDYSVVIRKLP